MKAEPADRVIIGAGLYATLFCARRNKNEKIYVLECDTEAFSRATYINQARVHIASPFIRFMPSAEIFPGPVHSSLKSSAGVPEYDVRISAFPRVTICYRKRISEIRREQTHYTLVCQEGTAYQTGFLLHAAYASTNILSRMAGADLFKIKYELCEIILCRAGNILEDTGITIMDGPFFSIMPFGRTGYHSLTSVTFTPHTTCYEELPAFSCQKSEQNTEDCSPQHLGNCSLCRAKPESSWNYMSALAKKYMKPEYVFSYERSLFSVKPILSSAVIYIDNAEASLPPFLEMLENYFRTNFLRYELIFVNDASEDKSVGIIKEYFKDRCEGMVTVLNMSYFQGRECAMSAGMDLVICDGGSSDGSTKIECLVALEVNTLRIKRDTGKQGSQLRMGFWWTLQRGYKGIITLDGNNKDSIEDVPHFIEKLEEGYDFIQGSRFIKGGRAVNTPFIRNVAVRLIHAPIISLTAGRRFTDTTNAFRGYSARYIQDERTGIFRDIFTGCELLAYLSVRASQLSYQVCEIPVTRAYPKKGKIPTKIGFFKGNIGLLVILFRNACGRYAPKSN